MTPRHSLLALRVEVICEHAMWTRVAKTIEFQMERGVDDKRVLIAKLARAEGYREAAAGAIRVIDHQLAERLPRTIQ
jgi:hypothetical protein